MCISFERGKIDMCQMKQAPNFSLVIKKDSFERDVSHLNETHVRASKFFLSDQENSLSNETCDTRRHNQGGAHHLDGCHATSEHIDKILVLLAHWKL